MSQDQEKKPSAENQTIVLDADGEDKNIVIAFGSALYRLNDISEALKQALFADQYSLWNKELMRKGMPQISIGSHLVLSGAKGQALGVKGQDWLSGRIRLKVSFELIPEQEAPLIHENAETDSKSPLNDFRQN